MLARVGSETAFGSRLGIDATKKLPEESFKRHGRRARKTELFVD